MTKYFAQDTPQAGLERMMMSVPGFQKRGSGMMILSRFCYKPEDVACRYCLHYRRRSCQVPICPYIAERLQSGAIGYRDLILECFGHIPHAGLHKQIIGLCLTTFLQATILTAGLLVLKDHALLGLGLMLSAGEVPRICGAFGLETSTHANIMSAVYAAQAAVNTTRTVVQAVGAAK